MPAPSGNQSGDARFRTDWKGRLILQIAEERSRDQALGGDYIIWRDATEGDLYRTRFMRKQRGLEPLI